MTVVAGRLGTVAVKGDVWRKSLSWTRAWVWAYGVLWALTVAIGLVVWTVPGGGMAARDLLDLALSAARNPAPSLTAAVAIAVSNALHCGWPLALGTLDLTRRRAARAIGDVAVGTNALVCAGLVGAALGGYGMRMVVFLPHLPLEWAGVSVALAGWMVERDRPVGWRERLVWMAVLVALLAAAAVAEVRFTPHR